MENIEREKIADKSAQLDVVSNFKFKEAWRDVMQGLAAWKIWTALSWQEFKNQYRRTLFGVAWVLMSFMFFIFVKLVIFTSLLAATDQSKYNAYLVVGFYIWWFLVATVNAAPDTFTSSAGWIRSERLPLSTYVFKNISREFYNSALLLLVVIVAFVYLKFGIDSRALYAIPAYIFLFINSVWLKITLGIIATKFRDISFFVKSLTMPLMFLTPIFWMPEQMGGLMKYLWWNPFYHYIEIFRAPLLGDGFPHASWVFVLTIFGVGNIIALSLFARFRQRIVFWL